jgi:hypothetical protein
MSSVATPVAYAVHEEVVDRHRLCILSSNAADLHVPRAASEAGAFPPIAAYGLLSDCNSAALVSRKGNKGDQQYAVPRSVDLARYSTAGIWCRAFSVTAGRPCCPYDSRGRPSCSRTAARRRRRSG